MVFSFILLAFIADIRGCVCDPARPETMQGRECSLTRVVMEKSEDAPFFFIRDANPAKSNRWLILPQALYHTLAEMSPTERTALWTAAIEKARSLWQDEWGIAMNSEDRRSQCQAHMHIGKVLPGTDRSGGVLVDRAEEIPLPPAGAGIWVHPEGERLRAHPGVDAPELGLMR